MNFSWVGSILVLYGVLKISLFVFISMIPPELVHKLSKVNVINIFITGDKTFAGHFLEYVLLVYGVFGVVHGLAIMNTFSRRANDIWGSKEMNYAVVIVIGAAMTLFYALVLYTQVPIHKDPAFNNQYLLYGLGGGLSFILLPFVWELMERVLPPLRRMPLHLQLGIMTLASLAVLGAVAIAYAVKRARQLKRERETTVGPQPLKE